MGQPQIVDVETGSDLLAHWRARAREVMPDFHWKDAVIHPLVFAVFPVMSLYVSNMGEGFVWEAAGIGASVLVTAALMWFLVGLFLKDKRRSAMIVSAFFVLFSSYGHAISGVRVILERLHLHDEAQLLVEGRLALRLWLLVWMALFVAAIAIIATMKRDLRPATKFLNVVALALVLMVGVDLAVNGTNMFIIPRLRSDEVSATNSSQPNALPPSPSTRGGSEASANQAELTLEQVQVRMDSLPDVYYIIPDAYARADILQAVYEFDNSEFLSYLAENGFYVADKSVSNYAQTQLSLASSLNLTYLDALASEIGTETDNRQPLQKMIRNSKVFRYFDSLGYTFVATESGYGPTEITDADIYMAPSRRWNLTEFQEALVTLTPLSEFRKTWFDFRRDRITYAFDCLAKAAHLNEPTFVFVHALVPHWPFIFDPDGHPVDPPRGIGMRTDYEYDEYVEGYRGQLTFVNRSLRLAIDQILYHSSDESIIIIQADHGPDAKLDPGWDIQSTYLPERMSILNAYYFPGQDYEELYEGITPVNTFRVVLNKYFGTDYDLLEDRSYFSSWDRPYLFTSVTEKVVSWSE